MQGVPSNKVFFKHVWPKLDGHGAEGCPARKVSPKNVKIHARCPGLGALAYGCLERPGCPLNQKISDAVRGADLDVLEETPSHTDAPSYLGVPLRCSENPRAEPSGCVNLAALSAWMPG